MSKTFKSPGFWAFSFFHQQKIFFVGLLFINLSQFYLARVIISFAYMKVPRFTTLYYADPHSS